MKGPEPKLAIAAGISLLAAGTGCTGESGATGPSLSLSAEQLNFGDVAIGHPQSLSVKVWNDGDGLLSVERVTTNGDGFSSSSVLDVDPDLDPGEGAWIDVWFDPAEEGPAIGSLSVLSNDPDDPDPEVTFLAVGITAALTVDHEGTLVFGAAAPGATVYESLTLCSTGAAAANILDAGLALGTAEFWIESVHPALPTLLEPGETAVVVLGYSSCEGATDTLQLVSDVPAQPVIEVELVGEAAQSPPACEILQPIQPEVVECTVIELVGIAVDEQSPSTDVVATWTEHFDGQLEEICSGPLDEDGYLACDRIALGVGPHTLMFRAEDPYGLTCEQQRVVVVTDPPPS